MLGYSLIGRKVWLCPGLVVALGLGSAASAAVVGADTGEFSATGSDTEFDARASSTDLINTGQPTLAAAAHTGNIADEFGYSFDGMHDGSAAANPNRAFWFQPGNAVVTYTLDTATNTLGYDITEIVNIQGHSDTRQSYANQEWGVSYSTVDDPATFIPLASVNYKPYTDGAGAGSTFVRLTDTTGVLATGVAALQFNIPEVPNFQGGSAVYRETDVFGVPTVPEPGVSLLAAAGLGAYGLLARRGRR
jgi:hypothetical protein